MVKLAHFMLVKRQITMKIPLHKLSTLTLVCLSLCSGCGSIVSHSSGSSGAYSGVRADGELALGVTPLFIVDYPFSAVADTLLLPVDLWRGPGPPKWPPAVDPLNGWNSWSPYDEESHEAIYGNGHRGKMLIQRAQPATHPALAKEIKDDYQNYLGKDEPGYYTMEVLYYEDGTGQHAVRVQTYTNGNDSYYYIFIYDKSNVRVKVMKYYYGHYSC